MRDSSGLVMVVFLSSTYRLHADVVDVAGVAIVVDLPGVAF